MEPNSAPDPVTQTKHFLSSALENFESALCLMERLGPEGLKARTEEVSLSLTGEYNLDSPEVIGQVCKDIAMIRSQFGHSEEAAIMLERAAEVSRNIAASDPSLSNLLQID